MMEEVNNKRTTDFTDYTDRNSFSARSKKGNNDD
jgi:hypothetical protein